MEKRSYDPSMNLGQRIVAMFIDSKITPLLVLVSILVGLVAMFGLAREEEPQINVTIIDLHVDIPSTPAFEVEQRVCRPLERLMHELPGVEYVYSTGNENRCLVSLRFYVGYSPLQAITEANTKVNQNLDILPVGATKPLLKVRNIDDVPVLSLTLWSEQVDSYELRRLAVQLCEELKGAEEVGETQVIGGERREIRVYPDRSALRAHGVMLSDVGYALQQGNNPISAGSFRQADSEVRIDGIATFRSAEDVRNTQIKNYDGTIIASATAPLRLGDIARIEDGPGEPHKYVHFTYGAGAASDSTAIEGAQPGSFHNAVTITVAKLPGASAIEVVDRVMEKIDAQRGRLIPREVHIETTRNYGFTATDKSNELLLHMGVSVVSVTLLLWFFLGWRASLVVAIAIPVTLALTLAGFYFLGYTLNRITLFALIFSIGILVDDPIVDIENIVRHLRMPGNKGRDLARVVIEAVNEVRKPLILATLAVIVAILPMSAVSGLMGPYMRPIPVGASIAMFASMLVAFTITPWASLRWLNARAHQRGDEQAQAPSPVTRLLARLRGKRAGEGDAFVPDKADEGLFTQWYRRSMAVILGRKRNQWLFWIIANLLLVAAIMLFPANLVKVKMLPFDNKNEFQVIIDMPEGTSLERTDAVAREMARVIAGQAEVRDVEVYTGTAAPFNFNGLIRHYYLRKGASRADLQVNLVDRHQREQQSHAIAKQVRKLIEPIALQHAAKIKVAEVPPGPPVQQTLVAEVYGPTEEGRVALAHAVQQIFNATDGVVDIDNCRFAPQRKLLFEVDPERAALNHIDPQMCAANLAIGLNGQKAGVLHAPREREQVDIKLQLPESERSSVEDILSLPVRGRDLRFVPLGEMMAVSETVIDQRLFHKNLMPVSYLMADVAGAIESPAFAIQETWDAIAQLAPNSDGNPQPDIYFTSQPPNDNRYAIKWDGEMQVTYEVFRDLGLAFVVALALIYALMVWWFESYRIPLIIMVVIPGSLIGILPAHALMGSFFSATSMIGFIAGAGIVVRNSIILVDFIQLRLKQGMALKEAVIDAGAVRFRPMMLTAIAVVVGSAVILMDPIFQGMAISLMAGEIASLIISRAAVPIIFYMTYSRRADKTEAA